MKINKLTNIWNYINRIKQRRAAVRFYQFKNPIKEKARNSIYRKNHLKKYAAHARRYRDNPKWVEWYKNYNKKYRIKNLESLKIYDNKRYNGDRKIKTICLAHNNKEGNKLMNLQLYNKVFNNFENRCHYCSSEQNLQIDHKLPVSKGGISEFNNLVVSCQKCNRQKFTSDYFEFKKSKEIENLLSS